ncbi:glycosyltransferase family 2 protein [Bacillales bacterium AN1005]|uniref:glycosyltransferase family 2 protein n=1 Tax=Niallia taxi TaxID=2499688 RepID=UPI0021A5122E|nr:glycosyltransferase family A protein [Niallia taxi]MCT2347464.1 glycosyltransferase family 2 protein [Niallia taxi]
MEYKKTDPLITIFMPVYNTEKYIAESINSILNQTYKNFELLIIDDGSSDRSVEIIKSYKDNRVNLIRNEKNMGLPYTRNLGLKMAKGDYIAIMDSDDISDRERLERQLNILLENNNISVVISNFKLLYSSGKRKKSGLPQFSPEEIKAQLLFRNYILNSSAMISKDFLLKNEITYHEDFFACQDYMFWIDCIKHGNIARDNYYLLEYRTGHENITSSSKKEKRAARKKLLDYIHINALQAFGFDLNTSECELFNRVFGEDNDLNKSNFLETVKLRNEIINQNDKSLVFEKSVLLKVLQYNILFSMLHSNSLNLRDKYTLLFNKDMWVEFNVKQFSYFFLRLVKKSISK